MDPGFGNTSLMVDFAGTVAQSQAFRWSVLNLSQDINSSTYSALWKSGGIFYQFAKSLGYRFRMINSTVPSSAGAGSALTLTISMTNDGWARAYNPRLVEVILRNQSGGAKYVLNVDNGYGNRLWLPAPAETKTLTISGGIPVSMAAGNYDVILNLPDPYASIRNRSEYSIRLANTGVWESSTGYNSLNHTLQITTSGGTAYTGSNWFALNGATTVNHQGILPVENSRLNHAVTYYTLDGRKLRSRVGASSINGLPQMMIRQAMANGRLTVEKVMIVR